MPVSSSEVITSLICFVQCYLQFFLQNGIGVWTTYTNCSCRWICRTIQFQPYFLECRPKHSELFRIGFVHCHDVQSSRKHFWRWLKRFGSWCLFFCGYYLFIFIMWNDKLWIYHFNNAMTLTVVNIKPLDLLLPTSVNADEIACRTGVFKVFTGGWFSSNVAIPVLSSTDKLIPFNRDAVDEMLRNGILVTHCFTASILNRILPSRKCDWTI